MRTLLHVMWGVGLVVQGQPPPDVVVIGASVMDVIFRLPGDLPKAGTSVQVKDLTFAPGGKALVQAVGCSRLGLRVALVSAVGDDQHGQEILDFLQQENVDFTHVKQIPMRTALAAVVQLQDSSILFGTRDIRAPQLDPSDIYELVDLITSARTVQLTFEAPYQTTNAVLDIVRKAGKTRPTVVVTPSPPYDRPDLDENNLACIDVMVARDWEITALTGKESANTEELAQSLRQLGVGYLCLLTPGTCLSYGPAGAVAVPPFTRQARKNSGERGAFCAALAKKLDSPPVIDESVLVWATAAMTLASLSHGVAEAMPTEAEVTSFMERYG